MGEKNPWEVTASLSKGVKANVQSILTVLKILTYFCTPGGKELLFLSPHPPNTTTLSVPPTARCSLPQQGPSRPLSQTWTAQHLIGH